MHMLCPKCEISNWLGTSRPVGVVHCTNCGIVLIRAAEPEPRIGSPVTAARSPASPAGPQST